LPRLRAAFCQAGANRARGHCKRARGGPCHLHLAILVCSVLRTKGPGSEPGVIMPHKLHGVLPPMTTPFNSDGEIEVSAIRQQVRFLLGQGAHGLVPGGSTGEGHTFETDELRRVIATVMEEAAGKVPVVAGVIVDSTRQAINKVRAIEDLGIAALQVTPVHYLFRPDDDHMLQHFRAITEQTGVPIIVYNVIPWSYLSPELLVRILNEVPGVIGVKQSAGDLKLLADLLIMAPKDK